MNNMETEEKIGRCNIFHPHKYTKWEITGEGTLTGVNSSPFIKQERTCIKCGKLKTRIESLI